MDMKKALVAVCLLVVVLFVLAGCSAVTGKDAKVSAEKRAISAKIRYFDGSMDTVVLTGYSVGCSGTLDLRTEDNRRILVGVNNVMIIEESEAQYNCVE